MSVSEHSNILIGILHSIKHLTVYQTNTVVIFSFLVYLGAIPCAGTISENSEKVNEVFGKICRKVVRKRRKIKENINAV